MNKNERRTGAVQVLKDAYRLYGEHPDRLQEHHINDALIPWLGWPATSAQITEAMATIATIHVRRTHQPGLVYQGQDIQPGDTLYADALDDYEAEDEATLHALIQQIEQE